MSEKDGYLGRASRYGLGALKHIADNLHSPFKTKSHATTTPAEDASESSMEDDDPASPRLSIAPPHHRERTALHALRDTFPNASSFLPTLPTIPCLGQHVILHHNSANEEAETLPPASQDAFSKLDGNVLMMGGYRGSILRDAKSGRRVWVPLRVGVNVRKVDLAIGLTDEDELRTAETVVPGKSLAAIAGFVDLGKRLKDRLKALDAEGQINFHSFGYDWRRSLELSSKELIDFLTQIKAETGRGTLVIAHSMGGLVALHALARSPDPTLFTGMIFGSTPWAGTPNIFQPFRWGDSILFNKTICSPSTVFSFRSSFYLLPTGHLKPPFENSKRDPLAVDIFDPESWKKYGLSPMAGKLAASKSAERREDEQQAEMSATGFASAMGGEQLDGPSHPASSLTATEDPDEAAGAPDATIESYLRTTLQRVARFREELISGYDVEKVHLYPPMAIITADHTPTVCGAIIDNEDELKAGQYDRLLFDKGDGIILNSSSTALPEPWRANLRSTIHSRHGHVSLLSDMNAVSQALESLRTSS